MRTFLDFNGFCCRKIAMLLPVACAAISACSTDGTPKTTVLDPWYEPPEFTDVGTNTWGQLNTGLPEGAKLNGLQSVDGKVYLSADGPDAASTGLYLLDRDKLSWSFVAVGPTWDGRIQGPLVAGPDKKLYVQDGDKVWRLDGTTFTPLADSGLKLERVVANPQVPGKLFAFIYHGGDGGTSVSAYDIASDTWSDYAPLTKILPILDTSHLGEGMLVAADGAVYISYAWAIRDSKGAQGAVFRWKPGQTDWEDATFNLRDTNDAGTPINMMNMTGNGWGPFGTIALGPGQAETIYGSSEQGAFALELGKDKWEKVAQYWGSVAFYPSPGYLFVADNASHTVDMMPSMTKQMRLGQPDLFACNRQSYRALTSPDSALVVGKFTGEDCVGGRGNIEAVVALRIDQGAPFADRNLNIDYASHTLSSAGDDDPVATAISTDGATVFAAANVNGIGTVFAIGAKDGAVLAKMELPGRVGDLALDPRDGAVIVVGAFGLTRMSPDLGKAQFMQALSEPGSRVDVAKDGRIATIAGKRISIFAPDGTQKATTTVEKEFVEDIAISSDDGKAYVVGFSNNHHHGNPVQTPYLHGYELNDLAFAWKTWGFNPERLDNDMADSRLRRATMGADGKLYVLGQFAGGNTIFRWNGRDFETRTLVSYDLFNDTPQTADEHLAYYARLDPATGVVIAGQFAIPRNNFENFHGNTFNVSEGSIAADEKGRVMISGVAAFAIASRDSNLLNGQQVPAYPGGDPSFLLVSPDFRQRLRWTTLTAGGGGTVRAVALGAGRAAAFSRVVKGAFFTTDATVPPDPAEDDLRNDLHLTLWAE